MSFVKTYSFFSVTPCFRHIQNDAVLCDFCGRWIVTETADPFVGLVNETYAEKGGLDLQFTCRKKKKNRLYQTTLDKNQAREKKKTGFEKTMSMTQVQSVSLDLPYDPRGCKDPDEGQGTQPRWNEWEGNSGTWA